MGTKDLVRDSPAIDGATLHVVNGENRDCSIDVRREPSVVGSGDDCDLVLNDGTVSARHFTVHIDTNGVRVVDLGSTNGTYLRGTRIDSACVSSESTLSVGATELILLTDSPSSPLAPRYGALIGVSPAMQRLYRTLRRVERIEAPVLITGETGSGKGVTARTIHEKSSRRDEPFVVLDCASISAELLESELFGHRVGSFTGAASSRRGVFEAAGRGTVFIDEVGELPRSLQTRLLRVVEDGRFRPVGAELEQRSEARIIAATHRPLDQLVAEGRFRGDLYFRLAVIPIHLPPLRERRQDIPLLVHSLIDELGVDGNFTPELLKPISESEYAWPGNVRELRNTLAQIVALGNAPRRLAEKRAEPHDPAVDLDEPLSAAKRRIVQTFERSYVLGQLERTAGRINEAARRSGMDPSQFRRILDRHR